MADKVYGICGTNKCKRGVIEKVIVTGSTLTVQNHPQQNTFVMGITLPYPDGYNVDNCMPLVIHVRSTLPNGAYEYHDVPYEYSNDSGSKTISVVQEDNSRGIVVSCTTKGFTYHEMVVTALLVRYE